MKRKIWMTIVAFAALCSFMVGCGTFEGLGEDIAGTSRALREAMIKE